MSDFEQRLIDAIKRGKNVAAGKAAAAASSGVDRRATTPLAHQVSLELCEHIERCMAKIPDHFPGFKIENVVSDRGWGTAVVRDDVQLKSGERGTAYSRCEVTVRPYSSGSCHRTSPPAARSATKKYFSEDNTNCWAKP